MIGTAIGHYRILERIGIGGMGVVYKAEDSKLGRTVALKFLPPELTRDAQARRRFLREARAAAKLEHPNICTVYDVGEIDDEQVWIAMACYEGETLKQIIERGSIPVDEALRIARQIADGLSKAHESGIVHRDVKPENVMVTREGVAKILDFGLAKTMDTTTLTNPGALLGTIAYMSPEQLRGEDVGAQSDVWSLGVILYEMLTGSRPFKGDYLQAVAYSILNETRAPVSTLRPDLPAGLVQLVERMLEREPSARCADGEQVVEEIDALTENGSSSGAHMLTRPRLGHRRRRQVTRAGIWAVVILVAVLAGVRINESRSGTVVTAGSMPDNVVIGVLPFHDISDELAPEVGAGFAHAMSARLGEVPGLQVVSSVRLDAEKESSFETDEELCRARGANLLLQGTLQRSGEMMRATWTILSLDGRQLGGNVAEGSVTELMLLQDAVSRQLLSALSHPEALEAVPSAAEASFSEDRYLQAMGYLTRYDNEASLDAAIRILETLGDAPQVQAALGRACYHKFLVSGHEREWADRALAACRLAVSMDPDDPDVHRTLGEIYIATSKYDSAESELERALELRPGDPDVRLAYADLLDKQDQAKEAETEFNRAIELRPGNWSGHNKLGTFYLRRNRLEEALAAFGEAERLTPDNTYVISNIGVTLYYMGRYDDALAAYDRSNRVRPTGPTYNNIGVLLYYLGRYDDAADAFERATALSPDDFQAWTGLADSLRWSEKGRSRADAAYRKAIELAQVNLDLNPRSANTLAILAVCHAKLGNRAKAVSTASLAVETAPNDAAVNYYSSIAMEVAGERDLAIKLVRHALELGYTEDELTHDPELRALVGELDLSKKRKEGA